MAQQGIADQAIRAGAFGGGREGVQRAELQGRTLETMGRAQQQGFNTALQACSANNKHYKHKQVYQQDNNLELLV